MLVMYLKSSRSIWYWVTLILALTTSMLVYAIPANMYPWAYLRNVLGILFVLFLPGYALTKIIFPNKFSAEGSENLGIIIQIAFSIGTSIALVSIFGLILYYVPYGFDLTPIVFSLLVFTIVLATASAIKESQK
jgi:uncharacterized membrane protein